MSETRSGLKAPESRKVWKEEIYWLIISLGFIWAIVFNILPITFPAFRDVFGATTEQMGRSQLLFFLGGLIYTAVGGVFIDRLGLRGAAIATVLIIAASLTIMGSAPSMSVVLVGAFCYGLAMASLDVVCSSLIVKYFWERRQSLFLLYAATSAFGGILGPAVLGWWQTHGHNPAENWRTEYYAVAALLVPMAAWAIRIRPHASMPESTASPPTSSSWAAIMSILTGPTIYFLGLIYLLHGVAQSGMVSWVGQLYQHRYPIDSAHAAYFLSFDLTGFFLGRSLLSWITARRKISELFLLSICAGTATFAYVATIAAPSYAWGLVFFMLSGFFISGDGPSINSYAGWRFAERASHAYVLLSGIGSIGSAVGAYITALIAERFGLEKGIWFLPGFSAALSVLAFAGWLRQRRNASKTVAA